MSGLGNSLNSSPIKGKKLNKLNVVSKKDIKLNNDYVDSLQSLGDTLSLISNLTNKGAAAWLNWGASILSAIAAAIPKILALTAVKEVEASTNAKVAVTGAAASVSSIPIAGPILAVAAIASVIAAMTSIPKFASGGIVPGGSYSGDKIPAMLNSGEMVLNGSQQSNLFKLFGSGIMPQRLEIGTSLNSLRESISPNESGSNIVVSGDWKARGSDLFLVLRNYMNKTGKRL